MVLQAPFSVAQSSARKHRTALIGSGWWGKNILQEAMASGRCRIVALCDADATTLEVTSEQVADRSGDKPKGYADYRELLDKEKPDIAIIATPDAPNPRSGSNHAGVMITSPEASFGSQSSRCASVPARRSKPALMIALTKCGDGESARPNSS